MTSRLPRCLLLGLAFILTISLVEGQVSHNLTYQGFLTDEAGAPKEDGLYTFTFRLYESSTGGEALWTEIKDLTVTSGLFSTMLGDATAIPSSIRFDRDLWLGIKVGAAAELVPRIRLTGVHLSYYSLYADSSNVAAHADTAAFALAVLGGGGGDVPVPLYLTSSQPDTGVIEGTNTYDGFGWAIQGMHSQSGYWGALGINNSGVQGGNFTRSRWGLIGGTLNGVSGVEDSTNTRGGLGYFDGEDYIGAWGAHGDSSNWGELGSATTGAYGQHYDTGNYGLLGSVNSGAFGRNESAQTYGRLGGSWYGAAGEDIATGNFGVIGTAYEGVYGTTADYKYWGALGSNGMGVWSYGDAAGWAGYFEGNVNVSGSLSKGAGSFLIDHPSDPENLLLRHNFVESPEHLLIYRGKKTLNNQGEAVVVLPDYFRDLTAEDGATVSLTPIGQPFLTGYELLTGSDSFKIYGDPSRDVSWVVYVDRDDPVRHYLDKPIVEEKGGKIKKGELLYPEAYGYAPPRNLVRHDAQQAHGQNDPWLRNLVG